MFMLPLRLLDRNFGSLKQFSRCISFFKSKTETSKVEEVTNDIRITPVETPEQFIVPKRNLTFVPPILPIRQAWVENLDTIEANKLGIVDLHPTIFGCRPRLHIIYDNVHWQNMYKYINWKFMPWKHEIKKSLRKAWPQKGMGRAQAGTRRSPPFKGAVKTFGPRGPKSYYYMLEIQKRIHGLCSTLSVKLAQEDLYIVNNLNIPTTDSKYLLELAEHRKWGPAVLFVDVVDIMPKNIALASNSIAHMNLMPVYGLNVHSMLKHHTLVLTLDAVEKIEQKLLEHIHAPLVRNESCCIRKHH